MKKISAILFITAFIISFAACKQQKTEEKAPEEKKAEEIVKSDKEKSDSILKMYQDKMKQAPDTIPAPAPKN